jgi:2-phosphosulfolactate phosphatase
MDISYERFIEGASRAKGTCVMIDVFRSSNTMLVLLKSGITQIFQIKDVDDAKEFKRAHPQCLLFGERDGLAPPGFAYGNSPVEAGRLDVNGRQAILCTSAGSAGICSMTHADEILIGSFANATAVARYLRKVRPSQITLVAMGSEGVKPAIEDDLCAELIGSYLKNDPVNFRKMKERILEGPTAKRLRERGQEDDLEFCLRFDIIDLVPKVYRVNEIACVRPV